MEKKRSGRKAGSIKNKKAAENASTGIACSTWIWIGTICLGLWSVVLILSAVCGITAYVGLHDDPENRAVNLVPTRTSTATPFLPWIRSSADPSPTVTLSPAATPTPTSTPAPIAWQDYPVVPLVSDRARAIYAYGLTLGNTPNAFSVIGDCEGTPSLFLGAFDASSDSYRLGEYAYLQETIHHFSGYFGRISRAAHYGFTTSAVLSPLWAHPDYCQSGERPLDCELRINRPSFALVMVGTMDYVNPPLYEPQMRIIIETILAHGTVPILYTKASNWEGNWMFNTAVGRLAYEYDIPLWNFWRAIQPLPGHGLKADGLHITWARNYFDDPYSMRFGWPWRNLTALQALDAVWRSVGSPIPDTDPAGIPLPASGE